MLQRSIFKIFISTHSLIKHIQCIERQYIIHSKTHTKKLKTGDVSFSLDTNIGLFLDKIGKTMLQQMFLRRKSFLENKTT
jgi:hypothetical protein